jgi:hypothetical protein
MICVYFRNNDSYETPLFIRPTPFVSISYSPIKNKIGTLGGTYSITLTGTLIDDEGSPFFHLTTIAGNPINRFATSPSRPTSQAIPFNQKLRSILEKQNALRELFSKDGQKIEILPVRIDPQFDTEGQTINNEEAILTFYPIVESVNFEEGIYVNTSKYTITLKADTLLDANLNVLNDGMIGATFNKDYTPDVYYNGGMQESDIRNNFGGFIEDFTENWGIEVEEGNGNTMMVGVNNDGAGGYSVATIRSYRLTRNVSATGKTRYHNGTKYEAWEEAKKFIHTVVIDNYSDPINYPNTAPINSPKLSRTILGDKSLNLSISTLNGYNHSRTENIDRSAGSYSLSDTWLLSHSPAYENYSMSINNSLGDPFFNISINGTIKGLTLSPASGYIYTRNGNINDYVTPYQNALNKYNEITNNGQFGLLCPLYKRAQGAVYPVLNSQPKSLTVGINEFTGEITYALDYNNRPQNLISGALTENISVNDTYPGDVFAVIPVIGRQTGPVLQYIGGRTEYRRDVGIEFTVDYNNIPYGKDRTTFLLSKPSLNEPVRTSLSNVINALSPANESGIKKYFINPPTESWNPKDGRYSLNLSWTYELDH